MGKVDVTGREAGDETGRVGAIACWTLEYVGAVI